MIWVVWPSRRQVDAWRPGGASHPRALRETDSLDGADVIPGFTHPVADLFA